jgi:hypothetical protein
MAMRKRAYLEPLVGSDSTMGSPKENKHLLLYRTLMVQIKERIAVIDGAKNNTFNLPDRTRYELCYLELRLICELIALGCLAAHGNIPAAYSQRLLTTYEPGFILSELEKLHPDFFPRACDRNVKSGDPIEFTVLEDGQFISKEDLRKLHGKTGNVLHMRRLKDLVKPIRLDFEQISKWRNQIVDLLAIHMISLSERGKYVLVIMEDPNFEGGPSTLEVTQHSASPGWLAEQELRLLKRKT